MLSDSILDFCDLLCQKTPVNESLAYLSEAVNFYSESSYGYQSFVLSALNSSIAGVRATGSNSTDALHTLLCVCDIVVHGCGFGVGSEHQLESALTEALGGVRYKLTYFNEDEFKLLPIFPFAREATLDYKAQCLGSVSQAT